MPYDCPRAETVDKVVEFCQVRRKKLRDILFSARITRSHVVCFVAAYMKKWRLAVKIVNFGEHVLQYFVGFWAAHAVAPAVEFKHVFHFGVVCQNGVFCRRYAALRGMAEDAYLGYGRYAELVAEVY